MNPADSARVGLCAILGLPNAGKSTLLNRILGVKNLSAPTAAQIIFVDTPGVQRGKGALRRYMQDQALAAAGDCDVALHVVDVTDRDQKAPDKLRGAPAAALGDALEAVAAPLICALNKVDRLPDKKQLLPILTAYHDTGRYAAIVPISALERDGLDRVEAEIVERLPEGPRLFPADMITDRAERFLAAELVREQLFRQLGAELPYASAVTVEEFEDRGRDIRIAAVVWVERESQKAIVIGKGGRQIKSVGERGRAALAELFGCEVHLVLTVKVSADWSRKVRGIRDMGYED
jgi:GTP-binding protein Era